MKSLWNIVKNKNKKVIDFIRKLDDAHIAEPAHVKLFDKIKIASLAHGLEANERLKIIGYQGASKSGQHHIPLVYDFSWAQKTIGAKK